MKYTIRILNAINEVVKQFDVGSTTEHASTLINSIDSADDTITVVIIDEHGSVVLAETTTLRQLINSLLHLLPNDEKATILQEYCIWCGGLQGDCSCMSI